jgi:DcmR-like sensory protein
MDPGLLVASGTMIHQVRERCKHLHAVKFYDTPASLCRTVAEFVGAGLNAGQPALVIATAEHGAEILAELHLRSFDPVQLQERGQVLMLDASDTLAMFMADGMPLPDRFSDVVASALAQLCQGRSDCTFRAYGEMVDVLWKQGQDVAAIQVEMLWNKLALTHEFSLLCAYSMGNLYKDAGRHAIHHQHTHVISEEDEFVPARRPARLYASV